MASNDDNIFPTEDDNIFPTETVSTDTAADLPGDAAAPAKKAAVKRAPRKATKKASAPKQAPTDASTDASTSTTTDIALAPAKKAAAKRAPRKSAKKDAAAPADLTVSVEAAPEAKVEKVAVAPGFGLLFQAPEPTQAPRRRRATAPAAAPGAESVSAPDADARQNIADDSDDSDDTGADGARRRRRRGGKGRRGRGTGNGDESATETASNAPADDYQTSDEGNAEASSTGQPSADDDESGDAGGSRRRTRRRRRGASGDNAADDHDDQPDTTTSTKTDTTTRVREPRPARDEVTSIKGSTRLEAKKQRRREGRESGRRRTIITEAEFLARRESVERVMVVRHKQDRTQIGVLEDGVLVEHYVSRETNASMAGNVYLGRIQNVLPSMEAAFVDIGRGRNAVLYAGEVNWDAAGLDNRARKIENALSSGQSVLTQVTKDPIGHKGARLTSQVSLPGRYLVYVPDGNMMGISRKLPDTERARLKKILREVVPEKAGVIVRTAAEGASEDELRADVTRLTAVWEEIQAKVKSANAPALLHGEPDLTVRVIRDVFNEDFASLVVSGDPAWETVSGYVNTVAPDLADRVQKWTGQQDLFTHYRVDEQIAKAMDRKVWLPSGGSLVIDRTEAMTVVDVNTGKFVGSGGNLEETVTKNNIEAAEEIVRQLRLRDIGGIIVIDFIDMVLESNRDLVVRRLIECLGRDRTKHQVAEVTSLGLVQMTRKRVGAGLIEVFSDTCEHCNGRGIIVSPDPIDRPAGDTGSGVGSGGDINSGGSGNNSGDAGSGRGARGRRARASGRDTGGSVEPEPKLASGGPTPAQIAATANAAAIHSASSASYEEPAAPVEEQSVDQPLDAPVPVVEDVESAAPKKSRRRSSRSAKSPAVSVDSVAALESVSEQSKSFETPATTPPVKAAEAASTSEPTPTSGPASVTEVTAPAARGRRKRARVVAPAGPPRAAAEGVGESASSGEFGS